jgi:anti-sigma regulatory factor (Ser/Thr protein kinase)
VEELTTMQDLSLHILDIAENSVRAGASLIEIRIEEATAADRLRIEIADNGQGMGEQMRRRVLSPFTTSRTDRKVGLGLSLLAQAARQADGECDVESEPAGGTRVKATFRSSHIDRKPLGSLRETFQTLVVGNPGIDFVLELRCDGEVQTLDTRELHESDGKGRSLGQKFPSPDVAFSSVPEHGIGHHSVGDKERGDARSS